MRIKKRWEICLLLLQFCCDNMSNDKLFSFIHRDFVSNIFEVKKRHDFKEKFIIFSANRFLLLLLKEVANKK